MWRKRITNKAGLDYINYIAKNFNIILEDKSNEYDKNLIENERKIFVEKLLELKEKYISSQEAKKIKNKNKELEEEKANGFKQQYAEKQENFERNMQEIFKRGIEDNKSKFEKQKIEYEQEIEKLENKIKKWQSMYTGQCEANKDLITTNTMLFNKLKEIKE